MPGSVASTRSVFANRYQPPATRSRTEIESAPSAASNLSTAAGATPSSTPACAHAGPMAASASSIPTMPVQPIRIRSARISQPRSRPGATRPPLACRTASPARHLPAWTAPRPENSRHVPTVEADRHRFKRFDGYPASVDSASAYSLAASSASRSTPRPCSYIVPSAIIAPARPCAAARRNQTAACSASFATHSP